MWVARLTQAGDIPVRGWSDECRCHCVNHPVRKRPGLPRHAPCGCTIGASRHLKVKSLHRKVMPARMFRLSLQPLTSRIPSVTPCTQKEKGNCPHRLHPGQSPSPSSLSLTSASAAVALTLLSSLANPSSRAFIVTSCPFSDCSASTTAGVRRLRSASPSRTCDAGCRGAHRGAGVRRFKV